MCYGIENSWRVIVSGKMPAAQNMAMDSAILSGVAQGSSPNTIRIYDWESPTVSFGYHQNPNNHIDLSRVAKNNFAFVRRPTGGRAVLHYDEVTYAVIAKNEGQFAGSILDVYKKIAYPILHTLQEVGIDATMSESVQNNSNTDKWRDPCFSSSSKYEINSDGKKIVGSAQVRKNDAFLQHGSILLNNNQEKMAELLPIDSETKRKVMKKYLAKKTIFINELLHKQISFAHFASILKENFMKDFAIKDIVPAGLSDFETTVYQKKLQKHEKEIESLRKNIFYS